MATLIQIRRGTAAEWTSANPTLAAGELALSTDLGRIKVGNGSSAWSSLPYISPLNTDQLTEGSTNLYFTNGRAVSATSSAIASASAAAVTSANGYTDTQITNLVDSAPSALNTLNELAAALNDDSNFATTVTNSLAAKLSLSDASATYLTQANAALTYDTLGSAAAAQSAATGYTDSAIAAINAVTSLQGTLNEIEVSASTGSVVLSLPSTINANTTGSAASLTTSRTIEISGDVSGSASFDGSANASITSTLTNTAVTPDTYGSASAVSTITVDSKGRITGASNTSISIPQSSVIDLVTDLSAKAPLSSPALTGTPTAPTAAYDDDSTKIATTAYVQAAIERVTINTQTSSYTLSLTDSGELIEINSGSANTLTIPLNSTVAFPIGTSINIVQYGSGQTTLAGESVGVTIRSKENKLKLTGQYSAVSLYKRGTDEWVAIGDLAS